MFRGRQGLVRHFSLDIFLWIELNVGRHMVAIGDARGYGKEEIERTREETDDKAAIA